MAVWLLLTVILLFAMTLPSILYEITAFPLPTAVTIPLESTVATPVSVDSHTVFFTVAAVGVTVTVSCTFSFLLS